MRKLFLLIVVFISFYSQAQEFLIVDSSMMQTMDLEEIEYVNISSTDKLVIEEESTILLDISSFDVSKLKVDSILITVGDTSYVVEQLTPFIVKDLDKSLDVSISMYRGGSKVKFPASNTDSISVSIKRYDRPLLVEDTVVFGVLAIVLALIFYTSHRDSKFWKRFYTFVPALLLCYLVPALLDTMGLISNDYTGLYKMAKNYLLPAALILMTIGIDFRGILNLGPKALIMFFTATLGIVIGGPIAIWVYTFIDPAVVGGEGSEAAWRGFATLAGSWIGGGANQTAMLELYGYKQAFYGKMITVDIVVAQLWMIFLLWGATRAHKFDKWLKADTSAIDDLKKRVSDYQATNAKQPTLADYVIIIGLTFGLVGFSHLAGNYLAPICKDKFGPDSPFASSFFWLVVLTTLGGLVYSATRIRRYEGAGASKLGSVFIYILVATIGMKMDLAKALEEPQLIFVGLIWMLIHVAIMFVVAKWIKAPFFFLAVGSKANIGGAASAPVVAAAFHPSLASVGALLAVLGYGIGSIAAIVCAELMSMVAPF